MPLDVFVDVEEEKDFILGLAYVLVPFWPHRCRIARRASLWCQRRRLQDVAHVAASVIPFDCLMFSMIRWISDRAKHSSGLVDSFAAGFVSVPNRLTWVTFSAKNTLFLASWTPLTTGIIIFVLAFIFAFSSEETTRPTSTRAVGCEAEPATELERQECRAYLEDTLRLHRQSGTRCNNATFRDALKDHNVSRAFCALVFFVPNATMSQHHSSRVNQAPNVSTPALFCQNEPNEALDSSCKLRGPSDR